MKIKKKIIVLIFLLMMSFCINVEAKEYKKYGATYCDIENNASCFSVNFYTDRQAPESYFYYGEITALILMNNTVSINNYQINLFKEVNNVYEWFENIGGNPPYLHVEYLNGQYYAFFSDKEDIGYTFKTYKLNDEGSKGNVNSDVSDVKLFCDYKGVVYGKDLNTTMELNKTKKTLTFSANVLSEIKYIETVECYESLIFCNENNFIYVFYDKEKFCQDRNIPSEDCSFSRDLFFCTEINYSVSETTSLEDGCPTYNVINKKYPEKITDSDKISYLTELKAYCNAAMANLNYSSNEISCFQRCLNYNTEFSKLYPNSNIEVKCGLSTKLINWILNIVKYIKYIIPVIVIVLGILDFIKAISADKDDGMQKAQQNFIKRLIAAALIFIITLIIGFILNKMGFEANGCGIIKDL